MKLAIKSRVDSHKKSRPVERCCLYLTATECLLNNNKIVCGSVSVDKFAQVNERIFDDGSVNERIFDGRSCSVALDRQNQNGFTVEVRIG